MWISSYNIKFIFVVYFNNINSSFVVKFIDLWRGKNFIQLNYILEKEKKKKKVNQVTHEQVRTFFTKKWPMLEHVNLFDNKLELGSFEIKLN